MISKPTKRFMRSPHEEGAGDPGDQDQVGRVEDGERGLVVLVGHALAERVDQHAEGDQRGDGEHQPAEPVGDQGDAERRGEVAEVDGERAVVGGDHQDDRDHHDRGEHGDTDEPLEPLEPDTRREAEAGGEERQQHRQGDECVHLRSPGGCGRSARPGRGYGLRALSGPGGVEG